MRTPGLDQSIVRLVGDILALAAQRPLDDGGVDTARQFESIRAGIRAMLKQHLKQHNIHWYGIARDVARLMWVLAWDETGVRADRTTRWWASGVVLGILTGQEDRA